VAGWRLEIALNILKHLVLIWIRAKEVARRTHLSERLHEYRESVFLARKLTHITCDMQLGVDIEGLRRRPPDTAALANLYDRAGFGPLLRRQGERLSQIPVS
jgi:hypothetical protein